MKYIFCENYGDAKVGDIVDLRYFNYDDLIIHLLLDARVIEIIVGD